jgi:uncharacterized protein (DUF433 family)
MGATKEELLTRITINPDVCHGKPTVRNMRYPVAMILDLLAAGMTFEELAGDYPALEKEDILACLAFAAYMVEFKTIAQLKAA